VHHGEMWLKQVEATAYVVSSVEAIATFNVLCAAVQVPLAPACGEKSTGFMVHEAGRWSDTHAHWFFAPRKLSRLAYDPATEEQKCVNLLIAAPDEHPAQDLVSAGGQILGAKCLIQPYLEMLPTRGCSDLIFVPGTNDCHVLLLRTDESQGGGPRSYASVIDLEGKVLMPEKLLAENRKFEGCAWIDTWCGLDRGTQ